MSRNNGGVNNRMRTKHPQLSSVLLLCAVALFVVACGPKSPAERPLHSGEQGIIVGFSEKNNFQFYEQDSFSIMLRLENDGAAHISKERLGYISVLYDKGVFSYVNGSTRAARGPITPLPFYADGRDLNIAKGEVEFADLSFTTKKLMGNREQATSAITFQVCYPYNTTYIDTLCVDRDIYNTRAAQTCIGHALSGTSQGAPIAVRAVEPSFLRVESALQPRFKITLTNLQNGYTIYTPKTESDIGNSKELCKQQDFNRSEFGTLRVEAFLNGVPLVCGTSLQDTSGIARFEGKDAVVICRLTAQIQAGANYETPLVVVADYIYIDSITADIEVSKLE